MKILAVYTEDNRNATADGAVEKWFTGLAEKNAGVEEVRIFIANHVQLDRLRVARKNGEIEALTFEAKGKSYHYGDDGRPDKVPQVFWETIDLLQQL